VPALTFSADGPRDGGEACVGRFAPQIPVWNGSDGVPLALALANWFRGPHIDGVALTLLGLRVIRSRDVVVTPDVRVLLRSWPLIFGL
jgi:hypothetical protein